MSKTEQIITVILVVCMVCLTAVVDVQKRKAEKELNLIRTKLDSLQHVSDSLEAELYSSDQTLYRYEVGYKILMERNPKAASQYGNIISDETE